MNFFVISRRKKEKKGVLTLFAQRYTTSTKPAGVNLSTSKKKLVKYSVIFNLFVVPSMSSRVLARAL